MKSADINRRLPSSLVVRLTLWQIITVATLLSGILITSYALIAALLEEDNRDFLQNQSFVLARGLAKFNTHGATSIKASKARYFTTLPELQIRLQRDDGFVLLESHDPDPPPFSAFPAPGMKTSEWRSPDQVRHLLNTVWVPGEAGQPSLLLQVAYGLEDDDARLRHIRVQMIMLWGVSLLLSGTTAFFIARRIFQPLAALTEVASTVMASQLHTQLDQFEWPSELVSLAHEFEAMLIRLDDSFNRLKNFSADLSHELRTPINIVHSEAEIALNRSRSPEEYQKSLESILVESARVGRLIDDLLLIAKSDSPENCINRVVLDAAAACRNIGEFFEPLVIDRNLSLHVAGQAQVMADPDLLRRALANLVDNAVRHTQSGGHIDLTVREFNNSTEIEIRDDGPGIASEHLPRISERFYRGVKSTDQAHATTGFGLGLPIVKSIMDLHGGTMTLNSRPDHGTSVTLCFPWQLPP